MKKLLKAPMVCTALLAAVSAMSGAAQAQKPGTDLAASDICKDCQPLSDKQLAAIRGTNNGVGAGIGGGKFGNRGNHIGGGDGGGSTGNPGNHYGQFK